MDYLVHHGIKGQKWGVRRFQNEDGSVTPAGAARYYTGNKKYDRRIARVEKQQNRMAAIREKNRAKIEKRYDRKIAINKTHIEDFEPIKDGLRDSKGRDILTADDVKKSTDALQKQIEKLQAEKEEKLKDFDIGSYAVDQGYNRYKDTIKNYAEAVSLAKIDSAYKRSPEYKSAVSDYVSQFKDVAIYGRGATVLGYAGEAARDVYDRAKKGG